MQPGRPFDMIAWMFLIASRAYRVVNVVGAEDIGLGGLLDVLRGRGISVMMAQEMPEPGAFDLLVAEKDHARAVRVLNRFGVVAN